MEYDLKKLGKGRIAVIGDFCLDVYWHADMTKSELSRETPHFPLPIVQERMSPGGAGNVVANLLALEPKKVYAIGVFGDDWRGIALKSLLEKAGADISGVVTDPTRVTNTYIKPLRKGFADNVVYEDPRLDFTNYEPLAAATEKRLLAFLDKVAKKVDVLCVCDQMPCGCITEAVRDRICALGAAGLTVIVDSRDRIGLYSDVIVKPNEIEASRVFKGKIKATDFEKLAKTLEARTGRSAIVTAGDKGCYVSEDIKVTHVPACKVTGEIDFCGAGDTFLSAVACATAAGFGLVDAAQLACCASAVTIKKLKTTGTASRKELAGTIRKMISGCAIALLLVAGAGHALAWPAGTAQPVKSVLPPASEQVKAEAAAAKARLAGKIAVSRIFGHRGDSELAPENTVPAFKAAVSKGFSIETDLYMTHDGVVYITHDSFLRRKGSGINAFATNCFWKGQLEKADAGAWKGDKWKGTPYPTLDDVLELAGDGRLVELEVKDPRKERILPLIKAAIERHPNVNSSNVVICGAGRWIVDNLPGYQGVKCTLPRKGWLITDPPHDLATIVRRLNVKHHPIWAPRWDEELITKELVDLAHSRGIKVAVWTVNDTPSAWAAFGRGVDWVLTDRPTSLWREMQE